MMGDLEGSYYGDQPAGGRRWFKVVAVIWAGTCLVLLFTPPLQIGIADTSETSEPDSLFNTASPKTAPPIPPMGCQQGYRMPHLQQCRMSHVAAARLNQETSDVFKRYGLGQGSIAELAIASIHTNIIGNRDVSVEANEESREELRDSATDMDDETKDRMATVSRCVMMKAEDMAGVSAPMDFFDPVGFAANTPAGKLLFYREVELRQGKVAMLAALGILVGEQFHPLFGGPTEVPSYLAFQDTQLPAFWPAVLAAIAIPELFSVFTFDTEGDENENLWSMAEDQEQGEPGFDPMGMKQPEDPKELKLLQAKELNNGRLAMIAAAGMIAQELATGEKVF
jgi:hypothetical protein